MNLKLYADGVVPLAVSGLTAVLPSIRQMDTLQNQLIALGPPL